jgi:hypothetical protein
VGSVGTNVSDLDATGTVFTSGYDAVEGGVFQRVIFGPHG